MRFAVTRLVVPLSLIAVILACDANQPLAPSEDVLVRAAGSQKGPSNLAIAASPAALGLT